MNEHVFMRVRFGILLGLILIAGFIQGMLMPIVAIVFQQAGIPSSVNGLHATGLYIGILIATPFMEGLLRKFGYKTILLVGTILIIIPLLLISCLEIVTILVSLTSCDRSRHEHAANWDTDVGYFVFVHS